MFLLSGVSFSHPMTPSAAPVLHSGLSSVLGAFPSTPPTSARRSTPTFAASSRGYGRPSTDFIYVGSPLFVDLRGLFPRLWPPFADFVYVGLPLYIDFRGLFTWLWPRFTDPVYVGSPLAIDSCSFFRRL
jgi:hypothetical protein